MKDNEKLTTCTATHDVMAFMQYLDATYSIWDMGDWADVDFEDAAEDYNAKHDLDWDHHDCKAIGDFIKFLIFW